MKERTDWEQLRIRQSPGLGPANRPTTPELWWLSPTSAEPSVQSEMLSLSRDEILQGARFVEN
jgi:hypothetical protein